MTNALVGRYLDRVTQIRREDHGKMEAETEGTHSQVQEHQRMPATTRTEERGLGPIVFQNLQKQATLPTPEFQRPVASRKVRE